MIYRLGPGPVRGVRSEEPSAVILHARVCEGGGTGRPRDGRAELPYLECHDAARREAARGATVPPGVRRCRQEPEFTPRLDRWDHGPFDVDEA